MDTATLLRDFAFSQYESACYLTLLNHHPSNGSQISRLSGIARSRIYDVLRGLMKKGLVFEIEKGMYAPLPFEELKKRLRSQFESNMVLLEEQVNRIAAETDAEYLMAIRGRRAVVEKAVELIAAARTELYLRLFPRTFTMLQDAIDAARNRGIGIRLIAMGDLPQYYDIQVAHPDAPGLTGKLGGESLDLIADNNEALVGIFETGREEQSGIIWSRNRWFVTANRDSLRHDFYHYFLDKLVERKMPLDERDRRIYAFIKGDD